MPFFRSSSLFTLSCWCILAASLLVPHASAFLPSPTTPQRIVSSSSERWVSQNDLPDFSKVLDSVDFSSITKNKDKILANLNEGELGSRGEEYVVAQFGLLLCIALGGVPIVGDFVFLLLGPGLLVSGVGALVLGVTGLGAALSPWPVPSKGGGALVQDGVFGQLRHPIYAGLLASCAGLSITSGSATRLFLTAVLWYVLDVKSDYEERELVQKYPEYSDYQKAVPSKFFPVTLTEAFPWTSK